MFFVFFGVICGIIKRMEAKKQSPEQYVWKPEKLEDFSDFMLLSEQEKVKSKLWRVLPAMRTNIHIASATKDKINSPISYFEELYLKYKLKERKELLKKKEDFATFYQVQAYILQKGLELGIDVSKRMPEIEDLSIYEHEEEGGRVSHYNNIFLRRNKNGQLSKGITLHEKYHFIGCRGHVLSHWTKNNEGGLLYITKIGNSGIRNEKTKQRLLRFLDEGIAMGFQNEFIWRGLKKKEFVRFLEEKDVFTKKGYWFNGYVLGLLIQDIAKKKQVEPITVLHYFQRGALQGNIGYYRLLKEVYGQDFLEHVAKWDVLDLYDSARYSLLKKYKLPVFRPMENKEKIKEKMNENIKKMLIEPIWEQKPF